MMKIVVLFTLAIMPSGVRVPVLCLRGARNV